MIHLVDNSVWQRIAQPVVFEAMSALSRSGTLAVSTPQMLEYGHSARNPHDYDILMQKLESFVLFVPDLDCHKQAMAIQRALWHNAKVRGAGAFDIQIAAIAIRHGVTVVHYDKNFQTIGSVVPEFRQRWIAPRGSLK